MEDKGGCEEDIMASSAALKAAKNELRGLMKQKLSVISKESIDAQSIAVFRGVTNLKPYQEAKRIGIYLSMPTGEIQTDAIVRHALGSGKRVFVPYLHTPQNPAPDAPRSVMEMVDLRSLSDYVSLKRDRWGIPTIEANKVNEREHILSQGGQPLDLILMPGVAFDIDPKSGFVRRLGHGKGFYDYFLHRYMRNLGSYAREPKLSLETEVLLYGLALEEQLLQCKPGTAVPVGEQDALLHGVLAGNAKIVEAPVREG